MKQIRVVTMGSESGHRAPAPAGRHGRLPEEMMHERMSGDKETAGVWGRGFRTEGGTETGRHGPREGQAQVHRNQVGLGCGRGPAERLEGLKELALPLRGGSDSSSVTGSWGAWCQET